MAEKIAYVVDFDRTVITADISTELALHFGGESVKDVKLAYRQRKFGMQEWLREMSALLPADFERMLAFALEKAELRSGFKEFLKQAHQNNRPVTISSDGFGFYIEPILEKYDCLKYVHTICKNEATASEDGQLSIANIHAHATCAVCGNCKAGWVLQLKQKGWQVVYIGDGSNDRFGASWSDFIFARDRLAEYCRNYAISFRQWEDFDEIIGADYREFANGLVISPFCHPGKEGYLL